MTTIGYIGQEVNECKITDDKKSELLYALLKNIFKENNEEVLETALEALKNFSFIITNIVHNKVIKFIIFNFPFISLKLIIFKLLILNIFIGKKRFHLFHINRMPKSYKS